MIFPPARLVESMTPSPASAGSDCPAQATKNVPVKPSISIAVQDPVAEMGVVDQVVITVMKILVKRTVVCGFVTQLARDKYVVASNHN